MQMMTDTGPLPRQLLIQSIQNLVAFEDKGLEVVPLHTDWGCTLKFRRQGRSLPWRMTLNEKGQCGIYKPATTSLPRVELNFPAGHHEDAKMMLVNIIQGGWI